MVIVFRVGIAYSDHMISRFGPKTPWKKLTFVALDIETTGKYPLDSEVCEIAAVKWTDGQIVDQFQSLVKPNQIIGEEVIAIHHITNEMVAHQPPVEKVVPDFLKFLGDSIPMAHHAPFDMGFLAWEFEKLQLKAPANGALCTAIISRKALPQSPNHRLQTLIRHLNLTPGVAHRALDDARSCMEVGLKCFETIGAEATWEDLVQYQGEKILWEHYSIHALEEQENMLNVISAIRKKSHIELIYSGGSRPNQPRRLIPVGIVRNAFGGFLVARELAEEQVKRFFLKQIKSARVVY
ncbi:MAG: 3'-5' exonuclease [Bdellovibrionales bacterium]|nr:3'-5' exonuclease [Bdellovibrionales bacterium]